MIRVVVRRVVRLLVTVWGAVTLVFFASRLIPTDPARIISGVQADEATIAAVRVDYGLDQPLLVQYATHLSNILRGDFGRSIMSGRRVNEELAVRLGATIELVLTAIAVSVVIAVPAALLASRKPQGAVARVFGVVSFAATAMPAFLVGVLLLYVFYSRLGIAPPPLGRLPQEFSGFEPISGLLVLDGLLRGRPEVSIAALKQLALPTTAVMVSLLPQLYRVIRAHTDRALALPATRAARRAGVRRLRIWGIYVLSPAVAPAVALLAGSFGYLLGGAVVVEVMFSWNGIGSWAVSAVSNGDYNVVQAVVLVIAVSYVTAYSVADGVVGLVDPRTRGERHA